MKFVRKRRRRPSATGGGRDRAPLVALSARGPLFALGGGRNSPARWLRPTGSPGPGAAFPNSRPPPATSSPRPPFVARREPWPGQTRLGGKSGEDRATPGAAAAAPRTRNASVPAAGGGGAGGGLASLPWAGVKTAVSEASAGFAKPIPTAFLSCLGETSLARKMHFQVVTWMLLASSLAGAMEIRVPDDPVIALFGRDATLSCSFSPGANFSLADLSLIWQLTDTKRLVHKFAEGQDQLANQGRSYANRTTLFYDQLPQGNASLLLRRVQIADEGSFTCFVRVRDYSSAAVALQVAALYSKPNLSLEPNRNLKPGDLVTVTCHAFAGYPEATVFWQDGRGNNLTENVTTSQVANEEGLFDVHSILRVVLEPYSTYSCLVKNPLLEQETHTSVTITGQHLVFPAVALWVTVGLAVCLLVLLGTLAYVCQKKIRQSCKEEKEKAGEQEDGEGSKTALQPLKNMEIKEDIGEEID